MRISTTMNHGMEMYMYSHRNGKNHVSNHISSPSRADPASKRCGLRAKLSGKQRHKTPSTVAMSSSLPHTSSVSSLSSLSSVSSVSSPRTNRRLGFRTLFSSSPCSSVSTTVVTDLVDADTNAESERSDDSKSSKDISSSSSSSSAIATPHANANTGIGFSSLPNHIDHDATTQTNAILFARQLKIATGAAAATTTTTSFSFSKSAPFSNLKPVPSALVAAKYEDELDKALLSTTSARYQYRDRDRDRESLPSSIDTVRSSTPPSFSSSTNQNTALSSYLAFGQEPDDDPDEDPDEDPEDGGRLVHLHSLFLSLESSEFIASLGTTMGRKELAGLFAWWSGRELTGSLHGRVEESPDADAVKDDRGWRRRRRYDDAYQDKSHRSNTGCGGGDSGVSSGQRNSSDEVGAIVSLRQHLLTAESLVQSAQGHDMQRTDSNSPMPKVPKIGKTVHWGPSTVTWIQRTGQTPERKTGRRQPAPLSSAAIETMQNLVEFEK